MNKSVKPKGPVQVVEVKTIPNALQEAAGVQSFTVKKKGPSTSARRKEAERNLSLNYYKEYEPSWVKIKYGAWYLKPEQWKVVREDEELADPIDAGQKELAAIKEKSDAMEKQLAQVHGARAFRAFLERKQRRIPEFMKRVALLQDTADLQKKMNESNNDKNTRPKRSTSAIIQKSNTSMTQ